MRFSSSKLIQIRPFTSFIHIHQHSHTPVLTHTHTHQHSHTPALTHTHTHQRTHQHTHTHTHIHTHTHTHTRTHTRQYSHTPGCVSTFVISGRQVPTNAGMCYHLSNLNALPVPALTGSLSRSENHIITGFVQGDPHLP